MGYVYYGRSLEYFEVARTEMIRSLGVSYRELEDEGIMLPVIHAELEYKTPINYDVEMRIEVLVYDVPGVRLQTYYKVYTADQTQEHVKGEVSLCFINAENRRPCRAPKTFLAHIEAKI